MKNGKARKVRNSKIYKQMAATYEAALKQVRERVITITLERDKIANENVELQQNIRKMTGLIQGYETRATEAHVMLENLAKRVNKAEESVKAWETTAIELSQENARLWYRVRMKE